MCATEAIDFQTVSKLDSRIVPQCAPPSPSVPKTHPDVRHRGHRNADRNQNRSDDHAGNGTEIACQCAPPWPSISKPKSKSHQKTSCADCCGEVVSNLISVPKSTKSTQGLPKEAPGVAPEATRKGGRKNSDFQTPLDSENEVPV